MEIDYTYVIYVDIIYVNICHIYGYEYTSYI